MQYLSPSRYFYAILGLLFFVHTNGQSSLSGIVVDENGQALAFANVVLLSVPDSSFVAGTTTDERGAFRLHRDPGQNQVLAIHLLGFSSAYISIASVEPNLEIPPLF